MRATPCVPFGNLSIVVRRVPLFPPSSIGLAVTEAVKPLSRRSVLSERHVSSVELTGSGPTVNVALY